MIRTRARNQVATRFDQTHGPPIDLPVALQPLPHFAAAFDKGWRIKNDAIKAFVPRIRLLQKVEDIGSRELADLIEPIVLAWSVAQRIALADSSTATTGPRTGRAACKAHAPV